MYPMHNIHISIRVRVRVDYFAELTAGPITTSYIYILLFVSYFSHSHTHAYSHNIIGHVHHQFLLY